jgi:hypothetical protein
MWLRRAMLIITLVLLVGLSVAIGWFAASWPVAAGGP